MADAVKGDTQEEEINTIPEVSMKLIKGAVALWLL